MPDGPDYFRDSFEEQDRLLRGATGKAPAQEESPKERKARTSADDADLDLSLKKLVARIALGAVAVQIIVADAVFIWYGCKNDWQIDTAAISAWLGATVTEVIGLAYVITNYLFPKGGRRR